MEGRHPHRHQSYAREHGHAGHLRPDQGVVPDAHGTESQIHVRHVFGLFFVGYLVIIKK